MASTTVENYLKQLFLEQQRIIAGELVSMGRLASAMGVTPGTATAMIKTLTQANLVAYEPRLGVRLTLSGEQLALHVLRRHRLLELFLVKVLGLNWSEVHEEAEHLEHSISEKVLQKIDELLGFPSVDPHGDPIPSAGGELVQPKLQSLVQCELNKPMRIARVSDQEPAFLQFLDRNGLTPGVEVVVEGRNSQADNVLLKSSAGQSVTLGTAAAEKILVEPS